MLTILSACAFKGAGENSIRLNGTPLPNPLADLMKAPESPRNPQQQPPPPEQQQQQQQKEEEGEEDEEGDLHMCVRYLHEHGLTGFRVYIGMA